MSRRFLIRMLVGLPLLAFLLATAFPFVALRLANAGLLPDWFTNYIGSSHVLTTTQAWSMRCLIIAWLFFVGGCFGSFLNVVAWRTPRGRGINGSSHCPHCDAKLRMTDNLPIIGWLKTAGQCRNCRTAISIRYLLVEIAFGGITLLLFTLTVFFNGVNLPIHSVDFRFNLLSNLLTEPKFELISVTCFLLILIYSLFTAVLIRSEGLKIPLSLIVATALICIAVAPWLPAAYVVDWRSITGFSKFLTSQGILSCALGAGAGLAVGWSLDRIPFLNSPYREVSEVDVAPVLNLTPANGSPEANGNFENIPTTGSTDAVASTTGSTLTNNPITNDPADDHWRNIAANKPNSPAMQSQFVEDIPEDIPEVMTGSTITDAKPVQLQGPVHVRSISDGLATMLLVGMFLGWQSVLSVTILVMVFQAPRRWMPACCCRALACQVFGATLVYILLWRVFALAY